MCDNDSIQPFKLSATDEQQAIAGFTAWLDKENILLVVIPGEGPEIDTMINTANSLINDPGNFYKAARIIWAPKPEFILGQLAKLKVDSHVPNINWNSPGDIAGVFITCKNNIITEVIRKPEIDQYIKSRISAGIVLGLGLDT